MPSLLEMLKAGAHFGHQKSRWHPKMEQYLFGARNGVHVIDLEKTLAELQKALEFVKNMAASGKLILFVGTKRQARDLVRAAAEACGMPYLVERWIGGMLTNFDEMKRRLKKYKSLKDQVATGEVEKYTKKEQIKIKKEIEKMDRYLIGLTALEKLPDAIYIADMRAEKTAVLEANRKNVPIIGVCDSNVNPEKAQYVIPANDDAVNSIKLVANIVAEAVNEGKKEWETNKAAAEKERAKAETKKPAVEKVERRALRVTESV